MTTARRRRLTIDDPLTPSHPPARHSQAAEHTPPDASQDQRPVAGAPDPKFQRRAKAASARQPTSADESKPPDQPASDEPGPGIWRVWSGVTGVGSFRLPHELLVELGDTAREHGLPIGLIVTAAITQLLDQPPETIAALVDRADDARIQGRRRSRRRLTTRSDD